MPPSFTLLERPQLMGILNVTPDSFYDGGSYDSTDRALKRAYAMQEEGADLIDIGGESTRPHAPLISPEEEARRLFPLLDQLADFPLPLSIDTQKPSIAAYAIRAGASLINDINGFRDPKMQEVVAPSSASLCVMHMRGSPQTMQQKPSYAEGVIPSLLAFFEERLETLLKAGIPSERILLDPGIGFGKGVQENLMILKELHQLKQFGRPLLIGLSRKSFMGKILQKEAPNLLSATLIMNTLALLGGATVLRVHDLPVHREAIELLVALGKAKG